MSARKPKAGTQVPDHRNKHAPPSTARDAALHLISQVLDHGRPLDDALAEGVRADGVLFSLESRDRAFARTLTATVLRRLGQIDNALGHCLNQPLEAAKPRTRNVLRLGAVQLLFLETPAHAAVDATVRLAGREKSTRGLVNAVLRRLDREGQKLLDVANAERLNTPDWLWQTWTETYGGEATEAIARAHVAEPPLDFSLKPDADIEHWAERLEAEAILGTGLRRRGGGRIEDIPGFDDGNWWIQDAAAALPARLLLDALGDARDRTIIDLCAAPGGKTAQLAAAGAKVIAVDRSKKRLARTTDNLKRLGLEAELVTGDAAKWRPSTPADAVLLDAPCTATGTLRRHPDAAHLKTPADVARMAEVQSRLADAARQMVRPGGILVFTTCSLQPEEGELQAARLIGGDFERLTVDAVEIDGFGEAINKEGDLRTLPSHLAEKGGLDGFFATRLRLKN